MFRRSKIKVRPAIRKPGPAAAAAKCTISNEDCSSNIPNKTTHQQIANEDTEITKHNSRSAPDTVKFNASEQNQSEQTTDRKIENHDSNSADIKETKINTSLLPPEAAPQRSRRRKLVACPLTAKERPRFNSPQNEMKSGDVLMPQDPPPFVNASVEAGLHQSEDISPRTLDNIVDDPVKNVVSEVVITDSEPSEVNDNSQSKEYTSMHSVDAVSDYTSGIPDNFTNETENNAPWNATNNNKEVHADKLHRKETLHTPSQVKKKPSKRSSNITIYRSMAKTKLRKLMDNQEKETNTWPKIDHNVISMSDLIYLNPPVKSGLVLGMNSSKANHTEEVVMSPKPAPEDETPNTPVGSSSETHSSLEAASEEPGALPVPQIRIAEDGSVVVDEESLIMEKKNPDTVSQGKTVYEFGRETNVNQYSFRKRPLSRPHKWSQIETEKFYKCLCIVGAEFSMMSAMFSQRSADDLRRKYRRELKTHPSRVDQALMQQHLSKWSDDMFEPKNISEKETDITEKADVT